MADVAERTGTPVARTLFGHPIALANLFGVFYLGINLGVFIGPLITGLLQTHLGFHYGFGAAAVGMALGLAQYVAFRRNLGDHGRTIPHPLSRRAFWRSRLMEGVH